MTMPTVGAGGPGYASDINLMARTIEAISVFYGASNAAVTAGSDTTSSTSFANMTGTGSVTSFSFTKFSSSTRVLLSCDSCTFFVAGGTSAGIEVALQIGGFDYPCGRLNILASQSAPVSGFATASGLLAGSYTIQARWRRFVNSGVAIPTRATSDWLAISAREVS